MRLSGPDRDLAPVESPCPYGERRYRDELGRGEVVEPRIESEKGGTMEGTVSLWVGIDWASEEHQVCGVDAQGHKVFEEKVRHSGDGITQFVDRLLERVGGQADQLAVAMETPRGAILEALIDRNVAAFSLNPKQLERFRDRYRVSGAKSDALDAFVLANSLRTDTPAYRRIVLGEATIVELRELRRAHTALTRDATALGARLREQLHRYYPQILQLGSPYDESWVWELLEQALTPTQGARLSHAKVESLLRRHHIRAVTAEKVVATLRSKALPVAPGVVAAASGHVQLLLPLIRLHRQQLSACMHQIDALLAQLATPLSETPSEDDEGPIPRDAAILLSVPGLGPLTSATLLTEGWQALQERDYCALRLLCGVAPVTSQTGKQRPTPGSPYKVQVFMRRACNEHLHDAAYHWARVASQREERAKAHYRQLRAAGHSHGRALRGVADRLLKLLVTLLRSHSLYDPARRVMPKALAA